MSLFLGQRVDTALQIWHKLHACSHQQSEGIPDRKLWEVLIDLNGVKPKLFQEGLAVMPPQVEQMGELANQRSFFSFILKCGQTKQGSQNQLNSM